MFKNTLFNSIKVSCKNILSFYANYYYNLRWIFSHNRRNKNFINNESRTKKIVVSLTSYPERINLVAKTLKTILNQSLKPDVVVLWLAKKQFRDRKLPDELLHLQQYGVKIKWCDDIRSYKKLIPALKEYPNEIIVTADDDAYYRHDWLEKLYSYYCKNDGKYICCNKATKIYMKEGKFYHKGGGKYYYKNPSFLNHLVGVGGVMYPPNSLDETVKDENLFMNLAPTNDDVWFWLMAVKKGTKIAVIPHNVPKPIDVYGADKTIRLTSTNDNNVNDNDNACPHWEQFYNVLVAFPEIKERLIASCNSQFE